MSAEQSALSVEEGVVVVRGAASGLLQEIRAGGHRLVSDEPVAVGGTGAGPTPYDLLLAALGACTSMTAALYARRKQWPLEAVTVRLRHARVHAIDCATCETTPGMLDRIEISLELTGPLTREQTSRIRTIVERCPLRRTLQSQIEIRTAAPPSTAEEGR